MGGGLILAGCKPISFMLWIAPSRSKAANTLCQTVLVSNMAVAGAGSTIGAFNYSFLL